MLYLTVLLTFASAVTAAQGNAGNETTIFRKCCPKNQCLVKVVNSVSLDQFQCVDRATAQTVYNITIFSSLFVAENVIIDHGIPVACDEIQITRIGDEVPSTTGHDYCCDRQVGELENDTLVDNNPKTVALICVEKEQKNITSRLKINRIRKCCPEGQSYDAEYHSCRDIAEKDSDKWLSRLAKIGKNYVYEVNNGLKCKHTEYTVELREAFFMLEVEGDKLKYIEKKKNGKGSVAPGDWCIDNEFNSGDMVAQVCTQNCAQFGAYCFRKCCPLGYHYKPFICGSYRSRCVPNVVGDDDVLFNMSTYLDPLKIDDNDTLFDVMGIQVNLVCDKGKFALNRSSETDQHWLTRSGQLVGPSALDPNNYCLEVFDKRDCPSEDVEVTGLSCYVQLSEKNFFMNAIINTTSAVCLALTLLVYVSLPELRNLHGRTIISHVSTMCFAYSCLARAQFSNVEDMNLCIFIGYGIYFGFVAAFVWLNVMCFDIWWTFGSVRTVQPIRKSSAGRRRFIYYSLYAWGVSLTFTLIVLALDIYPVASVLDAQMGHSMCWFGSVQNSSQDWPHYIFFVIPMGLMTCVNLVLWLLTARHCARVKAEVHRLQAGSVGERFKTRFRIDRAKYVLTGKLWVVMGAGWFSELFSTLAIKPAWLWTCVDLVNQLQGVLIFLILVFKPKVYYLIKKRLGLVKPDAQQNGTSSSARTNSTFLSRTISSDERTVMRTSLPNNGIKRA